MCNPSNVPSVSLATGVLMVVQELANSGREFSRYDITLALRQKCNNGELEIPEVETTGSPRFDIRKDSVDAIFGQYLSNLASNGVPPLKVRFDAQRGYRLFSADSNAVPPTPTTVSTPDPSVSVTVSPTNPSSVVSVPSSTLNDAEIRRRVETYMVGCKNLGRTPTLHQIQSAIKRGRQSTGLSCTEIFNVVNSLGYKI